MVKVLSLGGSVIVPDEINYDFLLKFREFIVEYSKKEKIVIVCGGGKTARRYINALEKRKVDHKILNYIGIRITRLNAWFLINFFKGECAHRPAKSLKEVKNLLSKNNIVIVGALRYKPNTTSDGTAADIAKILKTNFINITKVKGLYDKNPELKGAKLIRKISFDDIYQLIKKIKYKPGMNFVLDPLAAKTVMDHKIKTYIIGPDLKNLKKLLEGKKFVGTVIS